VSEAWRQLTPSERKVWDDLAARDKARFDVEKQMYQGPWKVAANRRTPKDPSAPKRPSSAFLAFSNKRRAELKKSNPNATNADLSKMLSKTWKTCDEETRREYTEAEAALRSTYKVNIAEWRRKHAEVKLAERKERETFAMQQVEMKAAMGMDITKSDMSGAPQIPPGMLQFLMQQAQAAQAGGASGSEGFNPAMLQFTPGQFPVPPATMLSQLLGTNVVVCSFVRVFADIPHYQFVHSSNFVRSFYSVRFLQPTRSSSNRATPSGCTGRACQTSARRESSRRRPSSPDSGARRRAKRADRTASPRPSTSRCRDSRTPRWRRP
jgi:HMG (high mobility group) box